MNPNEPAYPVKGGMVFYVPERAEDDVKEACKEYIEHTTHGLTIRQQAILMAMQGLCVGEGLSAPALGRLACEIADATLAAMEAE